MAGEQLHPDGREDQKDSQRGSRRLRRHLAVVCVRHHQPRQRNPRPANPLTLILMFITPMLASLLWVSGGFAGLILLIVVIVVIVLLVR